MNNTDRTFALFLFSLILFGTNGAVADAIDLPSNQIVLLRTLIGGSALTAATLLLGRRYTLPEDRRQVLYVLGSGIALGISWIFLYEAYVLAGVGISSMLYYCGPAIVLVLSPVIFRERLTAAGIIGFTAVLIGAILICIRSVNTDVDTLGYLLGIGSAVAHAAMLVFGKKVTAVEGLQNSSVQLLAAFATVLVYSLLTAGSDSSVQSDDWPPILVLGLANTAFGCLLYFSTIPRLRTQTISVWGYLEPLSALLAGVVILGEVLYAEQWLGALLILAGAIGMEVFEGRTGRHIPGAPR